MKVSRSPNNSLLQLFITWEKDSADKPYIAVSGGSIDVAINDEWAIYLRDRLNRLYPQIDGQPGITRNP